MNEIHEGEHSAVNEIYEGEHSAVNETTKGHHRRAYAACESIRTSRKEAEASKGRWQWTHSSVLIAPWSVPS